MSLRTHSHDDDDHRAHLEVAHDRYVAGLQSMLDEGTRTLGWLQAWPNQITNAEPDLESVLNALRVALRRATADEVTDPSYERESVARKTFTQDASGDLIEDDHSTYAGRPI